MVQTPSVRDRRLVNLPSRPETFAAHEKVRSREPRSTTAWFRPSSVPRPTNSHLESLELLERCQRRLHEFGLAAMTFQ